MTVPRGAVPGGTTPGGTDPGPRGRAGTAAPAAQGELDGMGAVVAGRLFACTPTRLATWQDCPRRYRFTYLDRPSPPKGPPWAHSSLGAAVHTALARWWSLPLAERTAARGGRLLHRAWVSQGFRDAAQEVAVRDRATVWVEDYLDGVDPAREPVGVERTVGTPTARLVLSGRVDRIDADDDGSLTVVDYKTGRRAPQETDARSSLALALYAVAAARTLRRPCVRVELHHLPTGTVVAAEHTPQGLERKVAEAESIATDAARAQAAHRAGLAGDDTFPAVPSRLCSWCDFRRHCPTGQAAAPELEPWAGLGEA